MVQTQPLRLQTCSQMLPGNDGYLATISDPESAAHGFFAFGPDHHAAQRRLVQAVWDHLTATGQMSLQAQGIVLQITTSVSWFPNSVLTRLSPAPLGSAGAATEESR